MAAIKIEAKSKTDIYVGDTINDKLFGANLLFSRDGCSDGTAVDDAYQEFVKEVSVTTFRYPGGTMTESYFDLANSESTAQNFTGGNGPREATVPLTTFINYAASVGATATIVLPTYRFMSEEIDGMGHRLIDPSREAELRSFIEHALSVASAAGTRITAFEVGNEWYVDNSKAFGFQMSPVEYGRVAGYLSIIVQEEITEYYSSSEMQAFPEPQIVVQVGPGGEAEKFTPDGYAVPDGYIGPVVSATQIIYDQIKEAGALPAIDGVLMHRYLVGADSQINGWAYKSFEVWAELAEADGDNRDFKRYVTEWNVSSRNDTETGNSSV